MVKELPTSFREDWRQGTSVYSNRKQEQRKETYLVTEFASYVNSILQS